MKWIGIAISLAGLCLLPACDSDKDQYAGLGSLVAERQEVRKSIAEENSRKKSSVYTPGEKTERNASDAGEENSQISAAIVYEKQIEILDSDSKVPLAKGVAYMNKSGQIVRIKVYKK